MTIHQQDQPFEVSSFQFSEENFSFSFENTRLAEINFSDFENIPDTILIDNQKIVTSSHAQLFLRKTDDHWETTMTPSKREKGPHRNGGFKDAFRNQVVFVYGTQGSEKENEWNKMKAMFDAETFGYRANGKIEVLRDVDFSAASFMDRNVIIYGNKDNNKAWDLLLAHSPIQVKRNKIQVGDAEMNGEGWATYFVYPREDSEIASVGVVSATGIAGMKAAFPTHYLVNGTSFPDVIVFDSNALKLGLESIKCAGFFGNDWSVKRGDLEWR